MKISLDTLRAMIETRADRRGYGPEYATNYGGREEESNTNGVFVCPDWKSLPDNRRVCDYLLDEFGIEYVFSDEYEVVYDGRGGKAWRTKANSYYWTPEAITNNEGDTITVEDDEEFVEANIKTTDAGNRFIMIGRYEATLVDGIDDDSLKEITSLDNTRRAGFDWNDDPQGIVDQLFADDTVDTTSGDFFELPNVVIVYEPSQFYVEFWPVVLPNNTEV